MDLQFSRTDEAAAVILILFAGGVYLVSGSFPGGIGGAPGPAFFPRFVVIGLSILSVLQFIDASTTVERSGRSVDNRDIVRFAIPSIFLIAYAAVLPFVGFLITTFVFLTTLMYYSGARDLRVILLVGTVVSVVLQNIFVGFLRVPLPEGPFELGRLVSLTNLL